LPENSNVTKAAIDEFISNPVWDEFKQRYGDAKGVLLAQILDLKRSEAERLPLLIEYNIIDSFLGFPAQLRAELEDEEKEK